MSTANVVYYLQSHRSCSLVTDSGTLEQSLSTLMLYMKSDAPICDNSSHSCYQAALKLVDTGKWCTSIVLHCTPVRPCAWSSDRSCVMNSPRRPKK